MELGEIDVNESSFSLLFTLFLFIFLKLIHTVNKELLGSASGLSDDVLHMDGVVGDLDGFPGLSIIPSEFKRISRLIDFSSNDKSSMISDIVDVVSRVSRGERDTTISRYVEVLLDVVLRKIFTKVTCANDDTGGSFTGVHRGVSTGRRVDF